MTNEQIVAIITSALREEAQTLFSAGRRDAAAGINEYLRGANSLSLIRLYDILETATARAKRLPVV